MAWRRNDGRLPRECVVLDEQGEVASFKSVHVRCFGGFDSKAAGHAPWPAGGSRPPTRWAIGHKPHPFEIEEWELA